MAVLQTFKPSKTQKHVMLLVKTAPTKKLAYDTVSTGQKNIAARDTLTQLGLVTYDEGSAEITTDGEDALKKENLIDDSGELTDEGKELLDSEEDDQDKEEDVKSESAFPLLNAIMEAQRNKNEFSSEEIMFLKAVERGDKSFEELLDNQDLFDRLVDFARLDMPYGTQKGRTGTPDEWILEHLKTLIEEIVFNFQRSSGS
jgi:hypothetical protein